MNNHSHRRTLVPKRWIGDKDHHPHRSAQVTTTDELDWAVKQGCSDPGCTARPEDHEEMYITPVCHPDVKDINVFYDRITKELCCACPICGKGIIKVKVA